MKVKKSIFNRCLFVGIVGASLSACGDDELANSLLPDLGVDVFDTSDDVSSDASDATDLADISDLSDASDAGVSDVFDAGDLSDEAADIEADDAPDTSDIAELDAGDASSDSDVSSDAGGGIDDGAIPIVFAPAAIPEQPRFSLGVQSGAMHAEGFLAWTFMTARTAVLLRVWREGEARGEVLLAYEELVEPNVDGYLHVPISGLAAGTWYEYAFFARDETEAITGRSAIGRVRTALAPGSTEPLTIGVTSCTKFEYGPYEALSAMADSSLDVFIHTGDQSYNDDEETLAEYRNAWFRTLGDPGYRDIHQAVGYYATWDDHEVTNDFDLESLPMARFEIARQAYLEALAVEVDSQQRIWRSYPWGDTAEFFILDSRSERIPSTRGRDDVYISRAQMDWLKASLAASPAHFKFILNSVPITDMPTLYIATGDRWEGYGAQREELLDWIVDEDVRNVWFLSGDFHIGMVSRVDNEGPARRILEIAAGPGGNSNPVASALGSLQSLAGVDQIMFHTRSSQTEVATVLHADPATNSVRVRFFEPDGTVLYDQVLQEGD